MDKDQILEILTDWNFWKKDLPLGVIRQSYLTRLESLTKTGQVVVVTGPRRAGKSYLMRQYAFHLIQNKIPRSEILFINFEDPRWPPLNASILQKIFETYLVFLNPQGKPILFLDEIQEVESWEKWVRMMHELGKAHLVLSGSNANLLSKELATLLTGRHVSMQVFPLSFEERLLFSHIILKDKLDEARQKTKLSAILQDYFEFGGFPQVVTTDEKKTLLLSYFDDLLNKDIIRRFKVRKPEAIKALARFYLSNPACPITFNAMERFLNLSADTAEKFSSYLEEAYLVWFVKRFSFKVKEQEKSPRKVYPVDTGLANALGFRFTENLGHLAETIVFHHLAQKKAQDPNREIFYWKNLRHWEVDFVIKKGLKVDQLIQVSLRIEQPQTKERETRAILKALEELKIKEGIIITEDKEGMETFQKKRLSYIPLVKWLLKKD